MTVTFQNSDGSRNTALISAQNFNRDTKYEVGNTTLSNEVTEWPEYRLRVSTSDAFRQRWEREGGALLDHIVTCGETCIHNFEPE